MKLLTPKLLKTNDPYGGFLLWGSFWKPDPQAPDPDMPGLKQQAIIYVSVEPEKTCLCGSGRPYGVCCRPKPDWRPVCHNPGAKDYSLVVPQETLFKRVDGPALHDHLLHNPHLACVEDTLDGGFWLYWGVLALETELGIICFGDFELKPDGSLLVTAMSDLRMKIMLDLLQEIAADCLPDEPKITKVPPPMLRKPPMKRRKRKRRKGFGRRS